MAKGIYKRGNIYWIRYAGLDGRTVFESSGSEKFRDAEELYIKRKKAIKDGKEPEIKKIANCRFKELSEKYKQWIQGRHRSANSKGYRIEQLVDHFGDIPLRRFDTLIVEQYQTDLLNKERYIKTKKETKKYQPASINKNISLLKAMFKKAVDWSMVEEDVLKRVRRCKQLQENNRRLRYLSKQECKELLNSCESHLRPIVVTALNTGMRKGEILKLKWDNVDLKHGFILLDNTKNGERREIPINDTLRSTLMSIPRRLDVPFVFYDLKSSKCYKDVKRSFASAVKRVKIHDFKFHDLRHTFASHLIMAGVDITTVRELLGHKDIKMTLRYAHLAPSHKVKAVDLLDSTINEQPALKPTIQKLYNQGERELTANA